MAGTSAPRPASLIDPSKGMKYPIQLGNSISAGRDQYVSVKYNHKPKHTSPTQKTTISAAEASGCYKLVISDNDPSSRSNPTYKYQGTLDPSTNAAENQTTDTYGLVFSQEKGAFLLEKISTDLHFNLMSAPGNSSRSQLARQYPQLPTQTSREQVAEDDDLFQDGSSANDNSDASAPDDDNPYDFRHFLPNGKYATAKQRTDMSRSQSPSVGGLSPYLSGQSPNPNGYLSASNGTSIKPKLKPKANPLVKPASRPSISSTSTKPKPKPTSNTKPKTKVTAASSAQHRTQATSSPPRIVEDLAYSPPSSPSSSDSDRFSSRRSTKPKSSSDLIIDMGSPPPNAKARKPLAHFKHAKKGGRPISFREATSASENEGDADESGLDLVDVDADADYDIDDDVIGTHVEDNMDVEDLKLPSPARVQTNDTASGGGGEAILGGLGIVVGGDAMMEEEDDLAAALTMELEKDLAAAPVEEESEVSEEE